ncbi:MAG: 30S ribosomal protein S4e [Candidatus Diapherotrites archaeon]|nr:30S ribosomal protein S4e [Candidatus Diapherotrites archaeon]
MAKKQGSKQQKTLSAPKSHFMPRKTKNWTIAYRPGTHAKKLSVPLGFALRDIMKIVKNTKEIKFLLNNSQIEVDGIVRKERNFPIGLFDIIEIKELKKSFRVLIDTNGRLVIRELPAGKNFKIARIMSKKAMKGGKIMLSSSDGRNFILAKTDLKPGDSVKTQVPENKIIQELKLQEGSTVLLIAGKHVGKTAKVAEIIPGTLTKERILQLNSGSEEFQTTEKNILVIGKEKAEIEVFKGE